MKKLSIILLPLLICLYDPGLYAQKKALTFEDIESWNRITEKVISPDGNWIAYKTEPWRGDSKVFLYTGKGNKKGEFPCGSEITITNDSRYMVFRIKPAYEGIRTLKMKNTPAKDMPGDILAICHLNTGKLDSVKNILNYKIPAAQGGWLAYQTREEISALTPSGGRLYLKNLETGKVISWNNVTEYLFSESSRKLFFVSSGNEISPEAGIYRYDPETGKTVMIISGDNEYSQVTPYDTGDKLAFLLRPKNQGKELDFSLYLWTGEGETKAVVMNNHNALPRSWRISENGRISFSGNGARIFFGTAPVLPRRDPSIPDDEFPVLDVWLGHEGLLHTVQLVNKERDLKRTYMAMYDLNNGQVLQIETEEIPQSQLISKGNADQVLLYTGKPYELESTWDPLNYDVYLMNLTSGKQQMIKKKIRSVFQPSPGGKYLYWFNYDEYSYYTLSIATGKEYRITEPGTIRAEIETNTTFDVNEPYGIAGWLEDDKAVLIYDRFDIWKVDPENNTKPINMTVSGRKESISYRLIRFGNKGVGIDEKNVQYLIGTTEITRATGYYSLDLRKPAVPAILTGGKYKLSEPVKAENAGTIVYTKESFEVFPDLILSDLTFRSSTRISNANPQQEEFMWGTAELYEWTSLDGIKLEGMLFKPENFDPSRKYPMIVTFFHKSSGELFNHRTPEFHSSRIDYHYYVSNGYLIFNPDVYFNDGYIGESAYKSVMPGVTALIREGFVDPEKVGACGHSYSGYQLAYIATRTDLFACIEAGAPVVNFFSAYGGIRWETGRSRAGQYEHDQTLATPWEAPLRFLENSPIYAADKITTPILILHNDEDGAVPWYQGIELFIALRRMYKPVWLLNYNGEKHGITQLKNKIDFQIRMSHFFNHYLKDMPMPEWMNKGIPAISKEINLGYEIKD